MLNLAHIMFSDSLPREGLGVGFTREGRCGSSMRWNNLFQRVERLIPWGGTLGKKYYQVKS